MPSATEHSMLPPLDAVQRAQVAAVRRQVDQQLAAHGDWLSFADYLRLVLYAPGLGYYSAGAAKFGCDGDFTTAPELSPLFGACVAHQIANVFAALDGAGGSRVVLELGAGSGALAESVLSSLDRLQCLPQQYLILEVSAELRQRQQQRLLTLPASLRDRVRWLDTLPSEPLDGVILSNEVADALPFECFAIAADGPVLRGVTRSGGDLLWSERAASGDAGAQLHRLLETLPKSPPIGYRSEFCPLLDDWVAAVGAVLRRGAWLLFDYGLGRAELYHPERSSGTLRCHFRHRAHDDPFVNPGLQDITAWVDFTRAAEAAVAAGLVVAGYCSQTAFLLGSGIDIELAAAADGVTRARVASEARQLLLPGEMGETFKAMALTRDLDAPLRGFAIQDLRRLL